MIYTLVFAQKQNSIYEMNGYKHTEGAWSSLIQHLFYSYFKKKNKNWGNATKKEKKKKKLRVVFFSPLKVHKHMVQPLGTFLKLSFDMIEFSYAQ